MKKFLSETYNKNYFWYYFGILALLAVVTFLIWKYSTNFFYGYGDFSYHLAVAQGFVRAKGIVFWDFWESLPLGRPHNYPPLFHLVMASFLQMGFSTLNVARLIIELVVVGGLILYIWGLTKLFNLKVAFWAFFFLVLSMQFIRISSTVLPSTLVVFTAPALLYFVINKKWLSFWTILVLIFYTHLFVPYILLFAILVYLLIFNRKIIWSFFIYSILAFICYLPWLIHVLLQGFSYIKYFDNNYISANTTDAPIGLNIIVLALAITGLIYLITKYRQISREGFFFLILPLIFLPFSYIAVNRFINGHGMVSLSVLAGLGTVFLLENRSLIYRYLIIILVAIYFWQIPYLSIIYKNSVNFDLLSSSTASIIKPDIKFDFVREQTYADMINKIKENSSPGESILSTTSSFDGGENQPALIYLANFFGSNTARPTLNLREPELYHRNSPNLSEARLIISNQTKDLELLSQLKTNMGGNIYLYKNNSGNIVKEKIPKHYIPFWLAYSIVISIVLIPIIISSISKRKLEKK